MAIRTFDRATPPHLPSLGLALAAAGLDGVILRYDKGTLYIEGNFGAITDAAILTIVTAAPQDSAALNVKAEIDRLPLVLQAIILSLVDVINIERAQHGRAAITKQVAYDSVKTKVDSLS